jgi:hypothetical protein
MPDVVIRGADFRVASRSRNLRGILTYSREHVVTRVDLFGPHSSGTGTLGLAWADGATCITDFADYTVMREWVAKRRIFRHLKQCPEKFAKTITLTEDGQ